MDYYHGVTHGDLQEGAQRAKYLKLALLFPFSLSQMGCLSSPNIRAGVGDACPMLPSHHRVPPRLLPPSFQGLGQLYAGQAPVVSGVLCAITSASWLGTLVT